MDQPSLSSLGAAIEWAATHAPSRGYRFVKDDKWNDTFYSFADIEQRTRRLAAGLQQLGLRKGNRVALILPDNDAFVLTFLAAVRVGIVPVPIYPPTGLGQLSGYLDNTKHIVRKSGAQVLVTVPMIKAVLGGVQAHCPDLQHVVNYATLQESTNDFRPEDVGPNDVAFLQFTSGSTSRPKGVVLTHANLLANIRNIGVEGLALDPTVDVGVAWLPLFHDMGLIGFVLTPLVHTVSVVFMSPLMFLKRPAIWLNAMSRYRGTITFGPNFAYALAVKRVRESELKGVDLSSWRVAGCGAEPIRPETLEAFAATYEKYGFRKEAFYPAYGLAESTLAVAFSRGVPTDRVKASTLWSEGRAEPVEEGDEDSLRIVNCGPAFEKHEVAVFPMEDETAANPLAERHVGEVRLRGPSVSQGYFEEPELSAKAFADGWFRTGDLGYLVDGNVHICGRSKEVIIVNGRNFYPQDIEWEASQVEGVRKGNVVAFGSADSGERERVVLAFETASSEPAEHQRMVTAIRSRVQESVGIALDDIVPLSTGVLPKTSSGKLQRTKARDLYENGQLTERKSAREADRVDQVKELARSQFHYLRLAVFGSRSKSQSS